jgi:L-ascorbate metabolism protein UlaG (beta-lactamase superfamily)
MPTQIRERIGSARTTTDDVLFIGTATLLIRYGGLTILTDPNFIHAGEEIPLGYGMTTRRLTDPAIEIDDLPTLDAVLLSHFHADHFDRIAEEHLDKSTTIITTPEAAEQLADRGFQAVEPLETWDTSDVIGPGASCTIRAMPGQHAPSLLSVALPEVMGSLLEFRRSDDASSATLRMYISGDTIMYEGLRAIPEREPVIDLAFLHLGGTRVMGMTVTMDAEQGVELLETLRPRRAVPIHYDDYDAFKSPLSDFRKAVTRAGLDHLVRYVGRGDRLAL